MKIIRVVSSAAYLNIILENQAQYMQESGIDYQVVAPYHEHHSNIFLKRENNVIYHNIEIQRTISLFADFKAFIGLLILFHRERPDIAHFQTPKASLLAGMAATVVGVPVRLFTIAGLISANKKGVALILLRFTELLTFLLSTHIISNSLSNFEMLHSQSEVFRKKSVKTKFWSSNGVDTEKFYSETKLCIPRELNFLFVGRICREKGIFDLLEAWEQISTAYPRSSLTLVGLIESKSNDELDRITRKIMNSGVRWPGRSDNIASYLYDCDILILPSYREGLPNVILEAGASGRTVIATDIPGCSDLVKDRVSGRLFEVGEVTSLVDCMKYYLEDVEVAVQHARELQKHIQENYSRERVRTELRNLYNELFKSKKP